MNLNYTDKTKIIELIKAGEKLPKKFIYKLFSDEEDVFLFWNGRKEDVTNVAFPFHSIEHIDEPKKEKDKPQISLFEKRTVEKGQAKFYDVAYLNTKEIITGKKITVELIDFVTHYTQDDIEDIQQSMRAGSKVVIEDGQIIKIVNDKNDTSASSVEEKWTGNYLFENEWQSFRTKKNPTLEFTCTPHEYKESGKYKIMVKVVNILGIDTSKIIEINL